MRLQALLVAAIACCVPLAVSGQGPKFCKGKDCPADPCSSYDGEWYLECDGGCDVQAHSSYGKSSLTCPSNPCRIFIDCHRSSIDVKFWDTDYCYYESSMCVKGLDGASLTCRDPPPCNSLCGNNGCCSKGETCIGGSCCPYDRACDNTCCPWGSYCGSDGKCKTLSNNPPPPVGTCNSPCGPYECCPSGWQCHGGHCCPQDRVCNDKCCAYGETCNGSTCTPTNTPPPSPPPDCNVYCNGQCCQGIDPCIGETGYEACCPHELACGGICCYSPYICSEGKCLPPPPVGTCDFPCGPHECCSSGEQCHGGHCCPPQRICGDACCACNQYCDTTSTTCKPTNTPPPPPPPDCNTPCWNDCCQGIDVCLGDPGYEACCPHDLACGGVCCYSPYECVEGKCNPPTNTTCNYPCGEFCCGAQEVCLNETLCCNETNVCESPSGDFECCADGWTCTPDGTCEPPVQCTDCGCCSCCHSNETCLGDSCCPNDLVCGSNCCSEGETCNPDGTCGGGAPPPSGNPCDNPCGSDCCSPGDTCVNDACCPAGQQCGCCSCCSDGEVCNPDGTCGSSNAPAPASS